MRVVLMIVSFFYVSSAFSQEVVWYNTIRGVGFDEANDISVGPNGEAYVVGTFKDTLTYVVDSTEVSITSYKGTYDLFLSKFSANGNLEWIHSTGGNQKDECMAVASDKEGNVYVTGHYEGGLNFGFGKAKGFLNSSGGSGQDCFIAKYNTEGVLQWIKSIGTYSFQSGVDIEVDESGNVYVLGELNNNSVTFQLKNGETRIKPEDVSLFVAKLNKTGQFLWVNELGGEGRKTAFSLDVNQEGQVVVCGNFHQNLITGSEKTEGYKSSGYTNDSFVIQYDSEGQLIWEKIFKSKSAIYCFDVAFNDLNQVYITGEMNDSLMVDDKAFVTRENSVMYLAKISNGKLDWLKHAEGERGESGGRNLCLDQSRVFVSGWMDGGLCLQQNSSTSQCVTYNCDCIYGNGVLVEFDFTGNAQSIRPIGGKKSQHVLAQIESYKDRLYLSGSVRGVIPAMSNGVTNFTSILTDVSVMVLEK